jgi:hypothetical protein
LALAEQLDLLVELEQLVLELLDQVGFKAQLGCRGNQLLFTTTKLTQ